MHVCLLNLFVCAYEKGKICKRQTDVKIDGPAFLETNEKAKGRQKARAPGHNFWPNGKVTVRINAPKEHKTTFNTFVTAAINDWESGTCIMFEIVEEDDVKKGADVKKGGDGDVKEGAIVAINSVKGKEGTGTCHGVGKEVTELDIPERINLKRVAAHELGHL